MKEFTDQELLMALKANDEKASKVYHDSKYKMFVYYSLGYINDQELAKDIVSEAFITLISKINDFESLNRATSYVYITIRSRCIDHYRMFRNHEEKHDQLQRLGTSYVDTTDNRDRAELIANIYNIVERKLGKKTREVLQFQFNENMSYEEIAKIQNTTVESVRGRRKRGIDLLRKNFPNLKDLLLLLVVSSWFSVVCVRFCRMVPLHGKVSEKNINFRDPFAAGQSFLICASFLTIKP